jgi:hypothetical protein
MFLEKLEKQKDFEMCGVLFNHFLIIRKGYSCGQLFVHEEFRSEDIEDAWDYANKLFKIKNEREVNK